MSRLKEIVKLFLNFYFKIYGRILKFLGLVDFPIPPNSNMRRTSANTIKRYIYSSKTTSLPISVAAQLNGVNFNDNCNVLDFGCGVAGQLNFFTKSHPLANYYATDVDPSSIEWLQAAYPQVTSKINSPSGILEFEDSFFDLIYTVSTFSHFSVSDVDFWLSELSRVTNEGGIFIPTIEGRGAVDLISNETKISKDIINTELENNGIFYKNYSWLNPLQDKNYKSINKSLDISSYFSSEYGHTVMDTNYFINKAKQYGFHYIGSAEKSICDRQDLIIFKKS
jgi:ubiquinone/menaquinone biosynthesis C-methylase UbiE|tara:strand:+ start:7407 stop:8249 length:843 start_codon:yes stop_codon:yes gene_type:complete